MQRLGHNQNLLHTAEYLRQSFCLAAALEALRLSSSVRWLRGLRCAGLSYNRTARHRSADGALCVAERVPLVEVSRRHTGLAHVNVVRTVDDRGLRQAVDYLAGLGHRDIIHVDGGTMPGAAERRRGYRAAMRRRDLADHIRILPGDYTEESGARAARELLASRPRPPPSSPATTGAPALGLLDSLIRAKIEVPAEVSVIGYDDSSIAHLSFIDLTSVR